MIVESYNEWDPLKTIVVGSAKHANKPEGTHYTDTGPFPLDMTEVVEKELQTLADTLESLDVKVIRPKEHDFTKTNGFYNYCPRDRLLIVGNTVVDCNMQYECRNQESKYLPDVIWHAKNLVRTPREKNIFFDAANVCRLNDTLLYLVSPSGSEEGAEWLQSQFPKHNVEITRTYGGIHIDSTFVPVREGLVVVNKDRVTKETLPNIFKDWEIIWLDESYLASRPNQRDGFFGASNYIQLNFLMVTPELAITDNTPLLKYELKQRGIECIPVPFTYSREMAGGHHCVTLDIHRQNGI